MKFNETIEKLGDKKGFFFVQIGSNDGVRSDPLYKYIKKYNWSGIMVEPVPYLFMRLVNNHKGNNNLILKNVAVSNAGGVKKFYYIEEHGDQEDWRCGSGLGSFCKETVLWHRPFVFEFDKYFRKIDIDTISFSDLVKDVEYIDLLAIDTEGYDLEIIKSIDFHNVRPRIIYYEHSHINEPEAKSYLIKAGYECNRVDQDNTFGILK